MIFQIGVTDVTMANQRTVKEAVNQLRKLGHAIIYDSTEDSMMKFISARIIHYRTCRACLEVKGGPSE